MEYRWTADPDRLPELAADLVRAKVDIIVTAGPAGIRAAKQATKTIPIVFAASSQVVARGFVESLARPGGNVTGISFQGSRTRSFNYSRTPSPHWSAWATCTTPPPRPTV